jgi:hypothetical protein
MWCFTRIKVISDQLRLVGGKSVGLSDGFGFREFILTLCLFGEYNAAKFLLGYGLVIHLQLLF